MSPTPRPPYLVLREDKAFWVETRPHGETSVTLQAFQEGCFHEAYGYDAGGSLWPILTATLKGQPSPSARLFAWRRVPVQLGFGAPTPVGMPDIIARLAKVLRSDNEFCDYLPSPPIDILRRFEQALAPSDIIRMAHDYGEPAA
jgi:hypothetical protein